jgi:hypothetical protein
VHSVPHADYRRGLIPGGCSFFTINLLERRIAPSASIRPH